jgi:hypothetical protein
MAKQAIAGNRKRTMFWLLGVLVAFVILDGVVTEMLIAQGIARESNPFLEPLVGQTGFLILKTVGALAAAFILFDIYRHWPKLGVMATCVAVAAYGGIGLWNTSLFILA